MVMRPVWFRVNTMSSLPATRSGLKPKSNSNDAGKGIETWSQAIAIGLSEARKKGVKVGPYIS